MVSVLRLLAFVLTVTLPGVNLAAQLQLDIAEPTVELGLPLHADLYAIDTGTKIANADWAALREEFAVVPLDSGETVRDPRWPGSQVQHVQARLYPRRTGDVTLAAVQLGEMATQPRSVRVLPGNTPAGQIRLESHVSNHQIWQRQHLLVTATITTPDKFASLQADPAEHKDAEIYALPASREFNPGGGSTLTIGWSIFPLKSGMQTLSLPPIDYRLGGKVMRRYYLPPAIIEVKPLPVYLTPTMPVGKVRIDGHLEPGTLLQPGNLGYWQIRLTGEQVAPDWMPAVLRQVKSGPGIQFLPPTSERAITYRGPGVVAHVTHTLPFKMTSNGTGKLPVLELQYFDPDSAKLVTVQYTEKQPWAINLALRVLLLVLASISLAWLVMRGHGIWHRWQQRRGCRHKALQQLAESRSASELRDNLRLLGKAQGWSDNLSLRAWLEHWQAGHEQDEELPVLFAQLTELCFARKPTLRLEQIRSRLHDYFSRRH